MAKKWRKGCLVKDKKTGEYIFEDEWEGLHLMKEPYCLYTRSKAEGIIEAHKTRMEPRYREDYPDESPMDLEILEVYLDPEGD